MEAFEDSESSIIRNAEYFISNVRDDNLELFIEFMSALKSENFSDFSNIIGHQLLRLAESISDEDLFHKLLIIFENYLSGKTISSSKQSPDYIQIDGELLEEVKNCLSRWINRFASSFRVNEGILKLLNLSNLHILQFGHEGFDLKQFFQSDAFRCIHKSIFKFCESRRPKLVSASIDCLNTYGLLIRDFEESQEFLNQAANSATNKSFCSSNSHCIRSSFLEMILNWSISHCDRYSMFEKLIAFLLPNIEIKTQIGDSTLIEVCKDTLNKWEIIGSKYLEENYEKFKERIDLLEEEENQENETKIRIDEKNLDDKRYIETKKLIPNFGCKLLIEKYGEKCLKSLKNDLRFP
ncbi:MAG: HEAT repeat-containing protein 2, partial [Marteilia pararefringens]